MGNKTKKVVKNSTKLFFSGVVVLTVANLLVKIIGLLFKIPMQSQLDDLGMGYYNNAYVLYTFFFTVSTTGLPIAVSIMISEARSKGQHLQIKKIFRTTVMLFVIIGLIGMIIMLCGAKFYSEYVLDAAPTYICIMAIAPTLFFICISSAYRGYFQGFQQMAPTAVSELLEALSKLVLGILFALYALEQGYDINVVAAYAIAGLTIGAGLGMIFLCITKIFFNENAYLEEFTAKVGISDAVDKTSSILKRLIVIALPITISASVMSLTSLIDSSIVQKLLQISGTDQELATAIYGNYTTLCIPMFNLPPVLIYPISAAIVPLIAAARNQGNEARTRTIMESALRVAVLVGIPCGFGMSVLSKPILNLFFSGKPDSVNMAAPLLRLLAPSTIFICILAITNAILQASGQERKPLISIIAGAIVKIISNSLLILTIGMESTPISTFLCYLTVTCFNFFFVAKYAKVVPNVKRVFLRPFICGILCAATALGSYTLLDYYGLNLKIATLCAILVAAVVYALLIFILKAVTTEDVRLLPKGDKICRMLQKVHLIKD